MVGLAETDRLQLVKPSWLDMAGDTIDELGNNFEKIDNVVVSMESRFDTAEGRLNAAEGRISNAETASKYFWIERKTLLQGQTSIVLTNTYNGTGKLQIKDIKYGCEWFSPSSWTISSKTITFPEMDEDMEFEIINLG